MLEKVFPTAKTMAERPWGKEECLVLASGKYIFKRLTIRAGCKGGLQFHRLKDECGYILKGRLKVVIDEGSGNLSSLGKEPGDVFHFPPGLIPQEEALEDCIVLEVTTPHANDRVRMENSYGIVESNEGLPTTRLCDVEHL